MDQDRLEGAARSVGGALEGEFGRATGDAKTQVQGKATELKGKVQNAYGQAKDTAVDTLRSARERAGQADDIVRTTIEQRPYTTAAVCLALGFFVGLLARRER
jgi:uncharacterized protein YjbJ (UPF0337 family)